MQITEKGKWKKTTDLLFCINNFGFQISGNDSPSENEQDSVESLGIYILHQQHLSNDFCPDYRPLICAEQDHVVGAEAQRGSSLLYGVVTLWENTPDRSIEFKEGGDFLSLLWLKFCLAFCQVCGEIAGDLVTACYLTSVDEYLKRTVCVCVCICGHVHVQM